MKKVWKELGFLGIPDRLIMLSRITGLSIGNAWPVLKEEELLGPVTVQPRQSDCQKSDERLARQRG